MKAWQQHHMATGPALQSAAPEPPKPPDEYSDRLAKYIPAEVVALYLGIVTAVAAQANGPQAEVQWLVERFGSDWFYWFNLAAFVIGMVATPLQLWYQLNVRSVVHILICMGSFFVWATLIPDGLFKGWPPIFRGILLPIYTFAVAFHQPK